MKYVAAIIRDAVGAFLLLPVPLTSFAVLDCFSLLCFIVHAKAIDVNDIHSTMISQGFTNNDVVF